MALSTICRDVPLPCKVRGRAWRRSEPPAREWLEYRARARLRYCYRPQSRACLSSRSRRVLMLSSSPRSCCLPNMAGGSASALTYTAPDLWHVLVYQMLKTQIAKPKLPREELLQTRSTT